MRAMFLTLHPDNLPETGKRQHENGNEARAIGRPILPAAT
jgi:hypothetical protein